MTKLLTLVTGFFAVFSPISENQVLGESVESPLSPLVEVITPTPTPTLTPTPTFTPTPLPTATPIPPSPTPTRKPVPVSSEQLEGWFKQYGEQYNVKQDTLRAIAYCESTFNPNATNYIYGGLFQFAPRTWESTRIQMGLDHNHELMFNPEEAIRTAAFKIGGGGIGHWPNCGKGLEVR